MGVGLGIAVVGVSVALLLLSRLRTKWQPLDASTMTDAAVRQRINDETRWIDSYLRQSMNSHTPKSRAMFEAKDKLVTTLKAELEARRTAVAGPATVMDVELT